MQLNIKFTYSGCSRHLPYPYLLHLHSILCLIHICYNSVISLKVSNKLYCFSMRALKWMDMIIFFRLICKIMWFWNFILGKKFSGLVYFLLWEYIKTDFSRYCRRTQISKIKRNKAKSRGRYHQIFVPVFSFLLSEDFTENTCWEISRHLTYYFFFASRQGLIYLKLASNSGYNQEWLRTSDWLISCLHLPYPWYYKGGLVLSKPR